MPPIFLCPFFSSCFTKRFFLRVITKCSLYINYIRSNVNPQINYFFIFQKIFLFLSIYTKILNSERYTCSISYILKIQRPSLICSPAYNQGFSIQTIDNQAEKMHLPMPMCPAPVIFCSADKNAAYAFLSAACA